MIKNKCKRQEGNGITMKYAVIGAGGTGEIPGFYMSKAKRLKKFL